MLKTIRNAIKESSFSSEIMREFLIMLDDSRKMLRYALKILSRPDRDVECETIHKKIYLKDKTINMMERTIRRRVLVHLSTHHEGNLSACLAFISTAKDAERLGDYVKDFFDLRALATKTSGNTSLYRKLFQTIGNKLLALFDTVIQAVQNTDVDAALEAMHAEKDISEQCERLIEEVASSDYSPSKTVVIALGARYMKRLACHLSNIVSSVVNPLTDIDFAPMKIDINQHFNPQVQKTLTPEQKESTK